MIKVNDKNFTSVEVIQASISESGKKIISYCLTYPRFVHSELMTHRLFSRNAMSSRAVPIVKMIEQVTTSPAMPVHWGKNQSGMQAKEQFEDHELEVAIEIWRQSATIAAAIANIMNTFGLHKQIANRVLEPFQMMKTIVTSTEFDNFFWLRCHEDAQPEIKVLADMMFEFYNEVEWFELKDGEYHVPYVSRQRDSNGTLHYFVNESSDFKGNTVGRYVNEETAIRVSSSCCAQVSYRLLDSSVDKANNVYWRLVESKPVHASPFEHQAKVMKQNETLVNIPFNPETWEDGITHVDKSGSLWSGNLQGFVQHRQLIPDNVCNNYEQR